MDAHDTILQTFKELVIETPYASITISSISKRADVSRKTFYKYFESRDDVALEQLREDFVFPVQNIAVLLPLSEIKSSTRLMMERLYRAFFENRAFYRHLIAGIGKQAFIDMFTRETGALTYQMYLSNNVAEIEARYAADILTGANALSLIWWLDHDDLDYHQMANLNMKWVATRLNDYNIASSAKDS